MYSMSPLSPSSKGTELTTTYSFVTIIVMAEQEKRNSYISFQNNKRKHSSTENLKQPHNNDKLIDTKASDITLTELNQLNTESDNKLVDVVIVDDDSKGVISEEPRKRSAVSFADDVVGGCDDVGVRGVGVNPRPTRVHFSEGGDPLRKSSKNSSVDVYEKTCLEILEQQGKGIQDTEFGSGFISAAIRPKDLKIGGVSHNPTGVKTIQHGPYLPQATLGPQTTIKPQHHRLSYMQCDSSSSGGGITSPTKFREYHPSALLSIDCEQQIKQQQRRSSSCPALAIEAAASIAAGSAVQPASSSNQQTIQMNPESQDVISQERLQIILGQLNAITHELAIITSAVGPLPSTSATALGVASTSATALGVASTSAAALRAASAASNPSAITGPSKFPRLLPEIAADASVSSDPRLRQNQEHEEGGGLSGSRFAGLADSQPELRGESPGSSRVTHQLEDSPGELNTPSFEDQKLLNSVARLNVGGYIFEVEWETLTRIPDSRLGRLASARNLSQALAHCDNYDPWKHEFYFNYRHRNFEDILTYYSTRSLHISLDSCSIAFVQDLVYWGLSEQTLEPCCLKRYVDCKESLDWDLQNPFNETDIEVFPPSECGGKMKYMWNLFEHPSSSIPARFIGLISITCIFLSTIILTLETLPVFQESQDKFLGEYRIFAIIEAVYMAWFTIEFIVRISCCPSKLDFIKKMMNWIDLLAIIPYFVTVILHYYGMGIDHLQEAQDSEDPVLAGDLSRTSQYLRLLKLARIIKTLRIIRIFKLARHSTGLQALGSTMRSNYKELGLLFLLLGMGAIMFASLAYVFEKENEVSTFTTMLDAYWWAIITMTTVGYGDVTPVTPIGKLIGCFCAIFGVLVIGLPIPIIGNSFNKFYARQKRWEKREALAANRRAMSLRRKMSTRYLRQSFKNRSMRRAAKHSDSQQTIEEET